MTADATLTCLSLMSTLKQSPTEQGGEVGPQGGRNMELPTPTKDKKGPVQVKRPGSNTSAPSRGGGGREGASEWHASPSRDQEQCREWRVAPWRREEEARPVKPVVKRTDYSSLGWEA